ncbi:MAG: signal peptide peptidase SppA, partial [Candidatus Woesearchaeota archaeon]
VVPLKGTLTADNDAATLLGEFVSSKKITEWIEKAAESADIKAIILDINSPGGTPVASDEIVRAVKRARQKKPVYSVIGEVGTSGAYWVASASDKILANPMSVTGSIGVLASYLEFSGLIKEYNVTYQRLVSGKYKDMGSRFKELTPAERELLQRKIDLVHEFFVRDVAENRKLPIEKVREVATGEIFLGTEALTLGLIDELGDRNDAIKMLERSLNITAKVFEFKRKPRLFGSLADATNSFAYYVGRGIGAELTASSANNEIELRT